MTTTSAPEREGRITVPLVLSLGSLTVFGPLCIDMYLAALPDIARQLHTTASSVQLSLTACLVGLAVGQLLFGPLSDQLGRRPPLFAGLALFVVASLACAVAPSIEVLVVVRFLEGLGGAAGVVIARAMVRDLYSGATAARFFSLLMMVTGLGPILAPQVGALLLGLGSWRFLFVCLAGCGVALIALAAARLAETLPAEDRVPLDPRATARSFASVGRDRLFLVNAAATGLGFAAIFGYVAGSSFVMENVYGLSPQWYSFMVACNGVGLVAGSQLNGRLVLRLGPHSLLTAGLIGMCAASLALLALHLTGHASLAAVLVCLFLVVFTNGFVGPNALALAMQNFPHAAGSAAALIGMAQFACGGLAAPLTGVGGPDDMTPMVVILAVCSVGAVLARVVLRPGGRPGQLGDPPESTTAQAARNAASTP